jgi:hypothetical protein
MKNPHRICPFCKSELEPGVKACEVCGRSLSDAIGLPVEDEREQVTALGLLQNKPNLLENEKRDLSQPVQAQEPAFGFDPKANGVSTTRQVMILIGVVTIITCLFVAGGIFAFQRFMQLANQQATLAVQTASAQDRESTRTALSVEQTQAWEAYSSRLTQEAQFTQEAIDTNLILSTAQEWPIVVEDRFDNNANGWYLGEGEDDLSFYEYQIENGVYIIKMTAKSGLSQWLWPDEVDVTLERFYFGCDMRMSGPNTIDGGAIFYMESEQNEEFYLFDITKSGMYATYLRQSSGWTILQEEVFTSVISTEGVNRIEIIGETSQSSSDRTFYFFINGEWVATMTDSTLDEGWIGIQVGLAEENDQGTWEFDNLLLRVP